MLEGFSEVLKILAEKVSRKAVIIALGMVLLYMLAATPNVTSIVLISVGVMILSILFTLLQWIQDIMGVKNKKEKQKEEETVEEEKKVTSISSVEESKETDMEGNL